MRAGGRGERSWTDGSSSRRGDPTPWPCSPRSSTSRRRRRRFAGGSSSRSWEGGGRSSSCRRGIGVSVVFLSSAFRFPPRGPPRASRMSFFRFSALVFWDRRPAPFFELAPPAHIPLHTHIYSYRHTCVSQLREQEVYPTGPYCRRRRGRTGPSIVSSGATARRRSPRRDRRARSCCPPPLPGTGTSTTTRPPPGGTTATLPPSRPRTGRRPPATPSASSTIRTSCTGAIAT